jgi:hypothetical protein
MALTQASLEYGGSVVQNFMRWATQAAQERWYFLAGGVLLLVLLWSYARK